MHFRSRTLGIIAVALIAALLFAVSNIYASHLQWVNQFPPSGDPLRNATVIDLMYGNEVRWNAGPPGTNLHGWATNAVNGWSAAIPQLSPKLVESSSNPHVIFQLYPGACSVLGPKTTGCVGYDFIPIYRPFHNAQYVFSATVMVNSYQNGPYNPGAEASVFVHEFGHVLGLNERYLHVSSGSPCNGNEQSVMDGMYSQTVFVGFPPTEQEYIFSCDGSQVYGIDANRVVQSYAQGSVGDVSAWWTGSTVYASWKDYAWGEGYHVPVLVKDPGTPAEQVVQYMAWLDNIGAWRAVEDRTIEASFAGVGPGVYRVCVAPFFPLFGVYGGGACNPFNLVVS